MVDRNPPREHVVVEVVRLGVVLAATAAGYALAEPLHRLLAFEDESSTRLVSSLLGALLGYLFGGILGRQLVVIVDSSALIDGRIAEVARTGYLEGTLVVPRFVVAGVAAVDDKRAALCRERRAALVTADHGLARTAEASGIRVLNPHALADAVRAPVLPDDQVPVRLVRPGKEPGQAIGYLEDGTMVIVEDARSRVAEQVGVDVTSIVQSRTGRLLFAAVAASQP